MPSASISVQKHSPPAWIVPVICLLGLTALGISALDLSAYGLAHYLNSDFLTPYFFCSDLLSGRYPMSGWTLSASPYFVPDHLVLGGLLAGFGRTGLAYALYTLIFYPTLLVLAGFCVKTAVGRAGPAFVAALLFGNLLLALRVAAGPRAVPSGGSARRPATGAFCCSGFAYLWALGTGGAVRRRNVGWLPAGLFRRGVRRAVVRQPVPFPGRAARRRRAFPRAGGGTRSLRAGGGGRAVARAAALLCTQLFKPLCQLGRMVLLQPHPPRRSLPRRTSGTPSAGSPPTCRDLLQATTGPSRSSVLAAAASLWSRVTPGGRDRPPPRYRRTVSTAACWTSTGCSAWRACSIMLPLPILSCGWRDAEQRPLPSSTGWSCPGSCSTLEVGGDGGMRCRRRASCRDGGRSLPRSASACAANGAAVRRRSPSRIPTM